MYGHPHNLSSARLYPGESYRNASRQGGQVVLETCPTIGLLQAAKVRHLIYNILCRYFVVVSGICVSSDKYVSTKLYAVIK
jgi:hypothetical protein